MRVIEQKGRVRLIDIEQGRFPIYYVQRQNWFTRKWYRLKFDTDVRGKKDSNIDPCWFVVYEFAYEAYKMAST